MIPCRGAAARRLWLRTDISGDGRGSPLPLCAAPSKGRGTGAAALAWPERRATMGTVPDVQGKVTAMSQMLRVKPTDDGTYTVYRGTTVLISGLTRVQAELYEARAAGR